MADGYGVQVLGVRRLRATMAKAGGDLTQFSDTNAEVGRIVATDARTLVPVRTGRLAATLRSSGTRTQAVVRAGYASVPYARPIHWGWPARHISAQPFATTAASRTEPRWRLVYLKAIDRILSRVKGV